MSLPEYISRLEAVEKISERTRPKHEDKRAWKNKINARIKYQIKIGKIKVDANDIIRSCEIAAYAQQEFVGVFDDWGSEITLCVASIYTSQHLEKGRVVSQPSGIAECHQEILKKDEEAAKLEQRVDELQAENERLKPDAERRRQIRDTKKKIRKKMEENAINSVNNSFEHRFFKFWT